MYLAISLTETRPINTRTFPSIIAIILKIFGCLNCSFINAVATLICASKTLFLFHVGTMLPPFCVCFASVLRQVCKHGRSRFITVFAYHIPVAPEAQYSPYHATWFLDRGLLLAQKQKTASFSENSFLQSAHFSNSEPHRLHFSRIILRLCLTLISIS